MKRPHLALIVILVLVLAAIVAYTSRSSRSPVTYHIRLDGGTAEQCTGRVSTAYSSQLSRTGRGFKGRAADCALNHPFWLLDQGTWGWLTGAGDTIQFDDKGPYYMGEGPFKDVGTHWIHCTNYASDCVLPVGIPAGTRILGANAGHCGTDYTILSGIHGLFWVLNVEGTDRVDLECIEITQPDPCSKVGLNPTNITSTRMNHGTATYGWTKGYYNAPKAGEPITVQGTTNGGGAFNVVNRVITSITGTTSGTFTVEGLAGDYPQQPETATSDFAGVCQANQNWATNGLVFGYLDHQGPSNMTVKDVFIHGIAGDGTLGSHFNKTASDTFSASNLHIFGNGIAGFDSDGGGCTTTCESIGTMTLTNVDAEWNGCLMIRPGVYSFCVDQAYGGNGDNFVMIATGGTWNWNHIISKNGMQDCFDSLHTGDDPKNLPTIHTSYMYAEGCEGAAIKMGGGDMTLRNSIGISNCEAMLTAANFPNNLPGWNSFVGSNCRANDSFIFSLNGGHTLTVENVDNLGQQGVAWDFAGHCNNDCIVIFRNNTTVGFHNKAGDAYMAGFYWEYPDPFANPKSLLTNNNYFALRTGCPGDPAHEKNPLCADPLFVAGTDVNHLDAHLTAASPLIGAGVYLPETSPDYDQQTRPNPEAIGYVEYTSTPPQPPQPRSWTEQCTTQDFVTVTCVRVKP